MAVKERRVEFKALDGMVLCGHLFEHPEPKGAILVCCATAVRQRFYFAFARWLCEQGFICMTFDYRGIGESLNAESARESQARKQDWGELDMPGALGYLHETFPHLGKHLVGHSAGGALVGLMPNYSLLSSVVAIGCTTGYLHYISMPYRLVAGTLLHVYFPLAIRTFGYLPAKRLGWGEDLPPGVALQWADWCTKPGYVKNAFGKDISRHFYNQIALPMLILNASDDPIATPANVRGLIDLFPKASPEAKWLHPKEHGLIAVGHMGFFWPRSNPMWQHVLTGLRV